MKIYIILSSFLVIFFESCKERDSHSENKKVTIYGYWKSQIIDYGVNKKSLILNIKDTNASFLIPYNHGIYKQFNEHFKFRSKFYPEFSLNFNLHVQNENQMILRIGDSSSLEKVKELILANNNFIFDSKSINHYDFNSISFYRMKKKNNKMFSEIYFKSGYSNGFGNMFYLKIESNGKVSYFGQKETKTMKGYEGFLKKRDITNFNEVINLLSLENISQKYVAPWTDDQNFELKIKFSDGTELNTIVYGFDMEPVELRSLISEILSVSQNFVLSESPKIKLDIFQCLF